MQKALHVELQYEIHAMRYSYINTGINVDIICP